MSSPIPLQRLLPAWESFHAITDIGPIRDDEHYTRMTGILEALLDETGGDEGHPVMGLADIVGDLIADYEAGHGAMPAATGIQALAFLMGQHGLGSMDLPEVGDAQTVSDVLAGQRELDIRQIRALAERFSVSPTTFI